jgi:PRC-barrel domain protein
MADETQITDGSLIAAEKVNGTNVYNRAGDKLGHVEDIMLDKASGRACYAIMSFGGFLGIGNKHWPLPWSALTYDSRRKASWSTSTRTRSRRRQATPMTSAGRRTTAALSIATTAHPATGADGTTVQNRESWRRGSRMLSCRTLRQAQGKPRARFSLGPDHLLRASLGQPAAAKRDVVAGGCDKKETAPQMNSIDVSALRRFANRSHLRKEKPRQRPTLRAWSLAGVHSSADTGHRSAGILWSHKHSP